LVEVDGVVVVVVVGGADDDGFGVHSVLPGTIHSPDGHGLLAGVACVCMVVVVLALCDGTVCVFADLPVTDDLSSTTSDVEAG